MRAFTPGHQVQRRAVLGRSPVWPDPGIAPHRNGSGRMLGVAGPATVLYAEDEAPLRELVAFWLEDAGFDVVLAADGAEALEQILADPPDLVVTDAMMPNLSGDDLVLRLKGDATLAGIPVVMATAAASPLRVQRMTDAGCHAVLSKPLDERSFLATVRAALASVDR